ncbi:hypothetical protein VKT23_005665 [Stygiomarasmius scandens]|uniref:Uncharacterized protein n=1 Tax=Marasmiellus scandens TaxID=2682957 RepID=A0ABR1JLP6_9AGAR
MARKAPNAPATNASTVVCCVDILLVKLAEATVVIAGGFPTPDPLPETLRLQREDDTLRASSQLPDEWKALPVSLGSGRLSSAAKRLCIKLLFAAYIIGPFLDPMTDPWNDSFNLQLADFARAMDDCVLQESIDGLFRDALVIQKRLVYAMMLSLFCATDQQMHCNSSPLRPRTFGSLLELLQVILGPGESAELEATAYPDAAQRILLKWGNVVPWSWKTWSDLRIAGSDCIVRLTASWLYSSCPDIIDSVLVDYEQPASDAILRVLRHCFSSIYRENGQTGLQTMLLPVCQATASLLRFQATNNSVYDCTQRQELGRHLLGIFVFLDSDESAICTKIGILESLILLQQGGALQNAVTTLCGVTNKDDRFKFTARLDDVVFRSRKRVTSGQMFDMEDVRITTCFLTLVWYNGAAKYIPRQSFVFLLESLVKHLDEDDFDTLRGSVMTALSVLGRDRNARTRESEDEILWKLFVTSSHSNLAVAASFAHYILVSGCTSDPLRCAEAWDYLRDALTMIMRHNYTEEEEVAALLSCDLICVALLTLIQSSLLPVQFILSSPWTMSLCSDLKQLLQNEPKTKLDYNEILKRRMSSSGKALLELIKRKLKNAHLPLEIATPDIQVQLIAYHLCCTLIMIPASV